ncbi:hypothetical protein [Gordonia sp. N1V]|uniref:hypothetical protein n=1 Tax=Gordonia sp. N1V TaxID=3034163 RepID=UPI0023E1FA1D|nr:hypothetical protein [Gordonia sp. N1V]MDF3285037.1 hypothetical protein [Gordonia sp. N1V]
MSSVRTRRPKVPWQSKALFAVGFTGLLFVLLAIASELPARASGWYLAVTLAVLIAALVGRRVYLRHRYTRTRHRATTSALEDEDARSLEDIT